MYDIGIIGALDDEVKNIISLLENKSSEVISGIEFNTGSLFGKQIVVARCGVGKVFAAICAEAMIIKYNPRLLVNSGVGGALDTTLRPLDVVIAEDLCQHDMDTSPIGDPVGLISGINRIYFECDERAVEILKSAADALGVRALVGRVASGDKFIAEKKDKDYIRSTFSASSCEMEGAAVAHTAFVNGTPFVVVRAISDSADGDASMDYMTFLPKAAEASISLTLSLIKEY